eukprot:3402673-Rhodomonas_salina.1
MREEIGWEGLKEREGGAPTCSCTSIRRNPPAWCPSDPTCAAPVSPCHATLFVRRPSLVPRASQFHLARHTHLACSVALQAATNCLDRMKLFLPSRPRQCLPAAAAPSPSEKRSPTRQNFQECIEDVTFPRDSQSRDVIHSHVINP